MKISKKLLPLLLVFALCAAIAVPAAAGGTGVWIHFYYYFSDETRAAIDVSELERTEITGSFVFTAPDGSVLTVSEDSYDRYGRVQDHISQGIYWHGVYTPDPSGLQDGTYILTDFPVPEGYSVADLSWDDFTFRQEQYDNSSGVTQFDFHIYLHKDGVADTTEPGGDTTEPDPSDPGEDDPTEPAALVAKPSNQSVLVNGEAVAFDAYNIEGSNYFKLRDVAFVLNGTEKHFAVDWDAETQTILLISGEEYTPNGSEMAAKGEEEKTPVVPTLTVSLDGEVVEIEAYNIDGNNYFKIRDLGAALGVFVDYDEDARAVIIDTSQN